MVKLVERYITTDGQIFEKEETAILREKFLEKYSMINKLQKELKELKQSCTHDKVGFLDENMQHRNISGENDWGDRCVVGVENYRTGNCSICGQGLEYRYNDDHELIQIVKGW